MHSLSNIRSLVVTSIKHGLCTSSTSCLSGALQLFQSCISPPKPIVFFLFWTVCVTASSLVDTCSDKRGVCLHKVFKLMDFYLKKAHFMQKERGTCPLVSPSESPTVVGGYRANSIEPGLCNSFVSCLHGAMQIFQAYICTTPSQ